MRDGATQDGMVAVVVAIGFVGEVLVAGGRRREMDRGIGHSRLQSRQEISKCGEIERRDLSSAAGD
jgi:hypothetical protein